MILLRASVYLLLVTYGGVALSSCIDANGYCSANSHVFDRHALVENEYVDYLVKINCSGRYQFFLGFITGGGITIGRDDEGNKFFVKNGKDVKGRRTSMKLLSHEIKYSLHIKIEGKSDQVLVKNGARSIPPYPFAFSPIEISIPEHIQINEEFLISVLIEADNEFYKDYVSLDTTLTVPVH